MGAGRQPGAGRARGTWGKGAREGLETLCSCVKSLFLSTSITVAPFSHTKNRPYRGGSISGLSYLFHWAGPLYVCFYLPCTADEHIEEILFCSLQINRPSAMINDILCLVGDSRMVGNGKRIGKAEAWPHEGRTRTLAPAGIAEGNTQAPCDLCD